MAAGFQCGIVGLTGAGVPASAVVTTNARVRTTQGYLGTVADVVQFPGPSPIFGLWVVPALRCRVGGVPAITGTATGIAYGPTPGGPAPVGPLQVTAPDQRASGT